MEEGHNKQYILFVASLASFITAFMGSSVNIALPALSKEFNIDAVMLSWISTSYLLAAAISLVPSGRLADLYGRKKIFSYGIIIFIIASLSTGLSNSIPLLLFSRILTGIGVGMIFSTSVAIVTSAFPISERGKAIGFTVSAVYLGLSMGPFLGGILTQNLGWRSIFFSSLLMGIITAFVTVFIKGEWAEARNEKMDYIGALIYGLGLTLVVYGFSILPLIEGLVFIVFGILFILIFAYWETRFNSPLINMKIFSNNKGFTFSNMAALIHYSATFGITFLLSLYLQYIKELGPQKAGLILLSQPLIMAIFSPFAGRMSDRIEPRVIATTGMGITFLGLLIFSFLGKETSLIFIVINCIIIGFGYALFSSPNMNSIMSSVEKKFYGIASAMVGTMRLIGQMLSMAIAMVVFAIVIGRVEITPEYYANFLSAVKISFIIFSVLAFIGIFASYYRGNIRNDIKSN
ncbi:MAG TPA: MFS transporter [Methanofastidiosum sp.]|jgi:EmrB/QacA subfamily drug resistance transporter|nr:MAG: Multidrug resistance protein stp [Firmicutes bacterium ADurb.Bin080]HNZ87871.1 MFS transporter [Methanofastidiosum sp.]HOC78346.1 MFS transporter [Methanofastidiosum sp.]HOG74443.1 MFS transporter [Methanofastidiosum sp.]HOR87246.1 MFS transporter [Methanofastidiosum sp.]